MKHIQNISQKSILALAIAAAASTHANDQLEEVVVMGKTTYGNSQVSETMKQQQSSFTSVNAVIDNLPGVSVNEGDVYGFDDWSTSITVRGFTTNLSDQQVGTTIDGMPNGGSGYGGGAKANRFVDPANLSGVEVSQGTADVSSRSHEALGGTLNYLTDAPLDEQRFRVEVSAGDHDAQRVYLRYDTGTLGEDTRAWISYAKQEASDWISESAENDREHYAAKLETSFGNTEVTAYISYDDIHEDNYQRIYSEAQYDQFSDTDGLTDEWTGVPFEDQLYRNGWSTTRENLFGYVKFDFHLSDAIEVSTSVYHHQNEGRGDWLPPYLVNVTADAGGNTEYLGGTTSKDPNADASNRLFYVDTDGNALTPDPSCVPSYTVSNWYGVAEATASQTDDPSCYPDGAIAVQSFRNTHYEKDRTGVNLDVTWSTSFGNTDSELRAGLWYEDQERDEYRDWHSVNTREGFSYNSQPYWIQYDRTYPQETTKWYLQETLTVGALTFSAGAKKFLVDVEREDNFDSSLDAKLSSDSDVLLSGGIVWETGIEGLEVFAGYAENFRALSDAVLERPAADLDNIEPETSETAEIGLRYDAESFNVTAVYYQNDFDNRLIFLDNSAATGPNFTIGTNGTYFNAGGIESDGLELSLDYSINSEFNLYFAYTYSDASYLGSGDSAVDQANGITPDNSVAGIPENQFVSSLDWSNGIFSAGVSAKYTDDRYVDQGNSWTADAHTVADLYIGATVENVAGLSSDLKLNFVVNNLFDEEYLGTIAENAAWLGGARTASLSATLDF
ncbi:MAG: TonB-dependent receptor [Cellvibrionaceae bacterium]|nr:TonB-dependent receptor [Cellvibrionaceae bacterium]|tara:strand:+ start:78220 stop:80580 length:2361 start_codon:yes stop_codon:yes gene_type:complete